jgi:S-adenosylmethionine:tRNA-ribosyltransferase-isomerase (queuine synthetase)
MGVNIAQVLLHVGLGTFRPVSCADIRSIRCIMNISR